MKDVVATDKIRIQRNPGGGYVTINAIDILEWFDSKKNYYGAKSDNYYQNQETNIEGKYTCPSYDEPVRKLAKAIAPDYPDIDNVPFWELLWAIRASYEGLESANNDLHKGIAKLQKRFGIDIYETIDIMKE